MMFVATSQIVAATAATLTYTGRDSDGEPTDPGTVTVGVVRSNGDDVIASGTSTTADGNARTITLTAAQTAQIDRLTATWTSGGTVIATTTHETVGGPLLTLAEFVQREPKMSTTTLATFLRARREVDELFRRACRRSFVPRLDIAKMAATHWRYSNGRSRESFVLEFPDLQRVLWADKIETDGTRTPVEGATLVAANDQGVASLGFEKTWPCGDIEIAYVHGKSRPPEDVLAAAARYTRHVIGGGTSSVPDRATSFADGNGGVTQLATPGLGPFITGIPEVDEVLVAHRWPRVA